jgi:hypothetical protein
MDTFKPGDYYEDCSFHPCLCTEVDGEGGIRGISLIDGSSPRGCDIEHCGVRKLTLEEVVLWKARGPQNLDQPWTPLPDKQWWWPRPIEGISPTVVFDILFESSLNYLRNSARSVLGDRIVGWYAPAGSFKDIGPGSSAEVSYGVRGSTANATIRVEAAKEGRLWPIQRILVLVEGQQEPLVFEGEGVRGCGRAG